MEVNFEIIAAKQKTQQEGKVSNSEPTNMSSFIHMCRLRQIQSVIQRDVYGVNVKIETLDYYPYWKQLDDWRSLAPYKASIESNNPVPIRAIYDTQEYADLLYNKLLRLLLQPFIAIPFVGASDEQPAFVCAGAAGQVCQLYKKLHQANSSSLGYTLLTLHSVFIAGMTILFCVWVTPEILKTSAANDLRACSSLLFVIAERWPSAKRYRDVFETLASSMLDLVSSGSYQANSVKDENLPTDLAQSIESIKESLTSAQDQHIWETITDFLGDEVVPSASDSAQNLAALNDIIDGQTFNINDYLR